jgi:hypothetical protein
MQQGGLNMSYNPLDPSSMTVGKLYGSRPGLNALTNTLADLVGQYRMSPMEAFRIYKYCMTGIDDESLTKEDSKL